MGAHEGGLVLKRALVFSGGGSRGSYEVGVWQALEEAGLRFHMCFGTSIGAINAALFLQGDRELAARLWDGIAARGLLRGGKAEGAQVERMFSRKREVLPFLLEHARQMRLDVAPLEALLRENLREGRVRAAGMGFGLVAVKFPSLAPAARTLTGIPEGQLIDWLLASSACFPIFPTRVIDGERYVDGGYCDNLPIDMALRAGAEEVLAVELHTAPTHPEYAKMPFLTTVLPRRDLGAFLDFDEALVRRNRLRGYCDAMKNTRSSGASTASFTPSPASTTCAPPRWAAASCARPPPSTPRPCAAPCCAPIGRWRRSWARWKRGCARKSSPSNRRCCGRWSWPPA